MIVGCQPIRRVRLAQEIDLGIRYAGPRDAVEARSVFRIKYFHDASDGHLLTLGGSDVAPLAWSLARILESGLRPADPQLRCWAMSLEAGFR
jgi:hypothetical protein